MYGYGYKGNHRNYSRITSSISVKVITRLLHILITCRAASTHQHKRVACKIKSSQMKSENMVVYHYIRLLNSFTRIKGRVYELKEVKLISPKILCLLQVMKISTDKTQKTKL